MARALAGVRTQRVLRAEGSALALLVAAAAGLGWLAARYPAWMSPAALAVVAVVGGFVLRRGTLLALYVGIAGVIAALLLTGGGALVSPGVVGAVGAVGLLMLMFSRGRRRLGVQGGRGESMLVDLRDRLRAQGEMPELPEGWSAEVVLRNAYGGSFAGDFLVAVRSSRRATLEVALVDVSGKGVSAGTRALLLSGAFGGLLGAMPREDFLPAANDYLLRQEWDEGFATAVHLALELDTGEWWLASAGHPPPAQYLGGSGGGGSAISPRVPCSGCCSRPSRRRPNPPRRPSRPGDAGVTLGKSAARV